jgi:hypothetical protein
MVPGLSVDDHFSTVPELFYCQLRHSSECFCNSDVENICSKSTCLESGSAPALCQSLLLSTPAFLRMHARCLFHDCPLRHPPRALNKVRYVLQRKPAESVLGQSHKNETCNFSSRNSDLENICSKSTCLESGSAPALCQSLLLSTLAFLRNPAETCLESGSVPALCRSLLMSTPAFLRMHAGCLFPIVHSGALQEP